MAPGLLCVPLVLGFLLLLPGTRSDCGPPPKRSDAIPDTNQIEVFSVGTLVAYRCRDGFVKIPGKSNTITCLSNSQWSNLQEFCGRSCGVPTRLKFAALKKEDESKSYYPVGINVSYTCRPGFENTTQMLPGSTCLENLTWSEVPELCKRKSCGDPGELLNGRPVKVTDNLFGAKIQFVCEDGYKLIGRSFIQCGLKGDKVEWSSLPTCQVISCSPPPAIANGTYNDSGVKNFVYNTTVTYRCEPGFRLSSTPFIWCTTRDKTSGIWSGPAPECKGECGALPTLSHAAPSDTDGTDSFPINTVMAYKCQDGFLKIPGKSNTVVCLSNSQWSNIEEFCGRSCPAPPRLKSAELNDMDLRKSYYPVGSNVSYVCRLAYESTALIPVITCLENLRWSEAPEFCLRKSCGVPKSPEHGRPANTTDNLFGAKVYILCDEGYKISGRTFIQCLLHRDQVEWTQLPTCQLITCSPPPPIINGMHNGSSVKSFDYNSTVTYRCDHNFSLTGEASIHCTTKDKINGVWNGSAPECKVVITQDKPTTVPSGGTEIGGTFSGLGRHIDIAIGTSIGTVVLVAVTALITLTVWKKKGIGEDQSWLMAIACKFTDVILGATNGNLGNKLHALGLAPPRGGVGRVGAAAPARLLSLLALSPAVMLRVPPGARGLLVLLLLPLLGAQGGPCEQEEIANGRMYVTYGSVRRAAFYCNEGYTLSGPASVQCVRKWGSFWDKELPSCQAILCPPPPVVANGSHDHQDEQFPVGSAVAYRCDPGFSLVGEASINCTRKDGFSGEWSGPAPECKGLCGAPPNLTRAFPLIHGDNFPLGKVIEYKCLRDFIRIPGKSNTVTCTQSFTWSPIEEFCGFSCDAPPRLKSATLDKEDEAKSYYPNGTTVRYVCRRGYEQNGGNPVTTCNENLTWSEMPELCRGKVCRDPKGPENGKAENKTFYPYGTKIKITCNAGFALHGRSFIQCLLNGDKVEWTRLPACQAILPSTDLPSSVTDSPPTISTPTTNKRTTIGNNPNSLVANEYDLDKDSLKAILPSTDLPSSVTDSPPTISTPTTNKRTTIGNNPNSLVANEYDLDKDSLKAILPSTDLPSSVTDSPPTISTPTTNKRTTIGNNPNSLVANEYDLDKDSLKAILPSTDLPSSVTDSPPTISTPTTNKRTTIGNNPNSLVANEYDLDKDSLKGFDTFVVIIIIIIIIGIISFVMICVSIKVTVQKKNGFYAINPDTQKLQQNGLLNEAKYDLIFVPGSRSLLVPLPRRLFPLATPAPVAMVSAPRCLPACWGLLALLPLLPLGARGDCAYPPRLAFAVLNEAENSSYPIGTKLKYSCRAGYMLNNGKSPVVTCLSNSSWSSDPEFCIGKPCVTLELQNGKVVYSDIRFGGTANFSCNEGYRLVGTSSAVCIIQGNGVVWDNNLPFCEAIPCDLPPTIVNGSHNRQDAEQFTYGSVVTYSCFKGFSLIGEQSIHCTTKDHVNGEWSGPPPECKVVKCPEPKVANGEIASGFGDEYTYRHTVTIECISGYTLVGDRSVNCEANSSWVPSLPICQRITQTTLKPTPSPSETKPTSGSTTKPTKETSKNTQGSTTKPTAATSLHPQGSTTKPTEETTKNTQGTNTGTITAMEKVPIVLAVLITSLQDTSLVMRVADEGVHDAHGLKRCQYRGEPASAPCRAGCGVPTRLIFAELKDEYKNQNNFQVGTIVRYNCRPGYGRHPGMLPIIKCLKNGRWSEASDFCKRKSCGHPGEPENGRVIATDALFGSTANFTCEEGHRLIGRSSRRCEILGLRVAWTGEVPICERIPCLPPPDIANGQHTGVIMDEFSYGSVVTYKCEGSYPLIGEKSIHCTTKDGLNGEWSARPPRCGARCRSPNVKNGRTSVDQAAYRPRDTAVFKCNPGYALRGSPETQCQDDGRWDPPVPVCERVSELHCITPEIQNGRQVAGHSPVYRPGSKVRFDCDPGYTLIGSHQIECRDDATWDPPVPVCVQGGCGVPTRLSFAELHSEYRDQSYFPIGKTVSYICQPGYSKHPQIRPTIRCLETGQWSEALEFCKSKSCGHPGEPENGRVIVTDTLFGSTANFTCEEGYRLIGESSTRCEISDKRVTWSNKVPICERIPCLPPPDIANGQHTGVIMDEFSYGSVVTYKCEGSYPLIGEKSIHCTTKDGLNGEWSARPPRCGVRQCPSPPGIDNGRPSSHASVVFTSGMSVIYHCDPGYSIIGEATIHCTASGNWSKHLPKCEGGCGVPTRLNFAELHSEYRNQSYFPIGKTVSYICRPGYSKHPQMRPTIICLETGRWSEALEFCKRKSCGHPGELVNGRIIVTDILFGSTVNFTCEEGHRLIGRPYRRCEIFGPRVSWSGELPLCQRIPCLPPPDILNGKHTHRLMKNFSYGSAVTYKCDNGYQLTGEASIHCTTKDGLNGEWSARAPRCEEVLCHAPQLQNGRTVGGYGPVYRPRERVRLECDPGYSLNGSREIECQDDATWYRPVPVCVEGVQLDAYSSGSVLTVIEH
ncbi:complement receptor type 1-like [Carettochelys insculpta]|uniref:complement receptor type 1-like n=1 Tax=Carettochelys insculpta TaxID=44489 RepID=UPI003EC03D6A